MAFDVGAGVRRNDAALKRDIERALAHQRKAIERVLDDYGVPRLGAQGLGAGGALGTTSSGANGSAVAEAEQRAAARHIGDATVNPAAATSLRRE